MKKPGILLVWNRMGDYHRARWKALQEVTTTYAADLGAGDTLYQWNNTEAAAGYFLLSNKPVNQPDWYNRVKNFLHLVSGQSINVVCIAGYGQPEYLVFIILGKLLGKKVILFAESWYAGNTITDKLKGLFIKLFCNGILASGKRAKNHFSKRLGFPEHKVETGYSVVDNEHFTKVAAPSQREAVKQLFFQKALPSTCAEEEYFSPVLLCVARFAPEKNLQMLIEAFQESQLVSNWQLVIVGGGSEEDALNKAIKSDAVTLLPWQPYELLPALYQQASCFILPSTFEPWGLVVNEAMAAGLPVIASEQCGCVPELVKETNGYTFEAEDKASLVETLNHLSTVSQRELKTMGEASGKIIQDFTPQSWAKRIIELAG